MGLMDFIKGELIDVIEWTDDSRDTLSFRFPDDDKAIKNGAQLIVRESQQVQFIYVGEFGDTFGPGKHTLTTDNIPVLTKLKSWKYGFNSPFKADVYYLNTRLFTGNKWGTANPIMMRDNDLGIVRVRAFGTYDFRIVDPKLFLKEVAGSDQNFRLDEFADTMRSRIVSVFADAQASAQDSGVRRRQPLHRARRSAAAAHQPGDRREVRPRDRELHRRERVGAAGGRAGDRQALEHGGGRQPERLRQVPDGAGAWRRAAVRAAPRRSWPSGLSIAQQIMQQQGMPGTTAASAATAAVALPDLLSPADAAKALGVPETRRDGDHRVRRARGEEDRHGLPDQAQRARRVPGETGH